MQPDPYMHLQLHEQEVDRRLAAKALQREARRVNAALNAPSGAFRVNAGRGRLGAAVGAVAVLARAFGVGRRAGI
jgi:hypothetical protein